MISFVNVTRAVAGRSIRKMFSSPALLLPSVIPPLFVLIAFAGGLSRLAGARDFDYPLGYTAFIFIFIFASLQSATIAGVFTGFSVARDFETGFARRLLLTAPARTGIIAGYLAAAVVRWAVTGAIVTIAAIAGGISIGGNGIDIIGLLGLGLLANLTAALWACGTAMLLRTEQAGALIQLPVFVILFLAPVYVPLHLLTGWIHDVASVNPATPVLETARGLLAGAPVDIALSFGLLAGGIIVTGAWARRGLASAERAG
jgi:ABC-2 type transport system permease protein